MFLDVAAAAADDNSGVGDDDGGGDDDNDNVIDDDDDNLVTVVVMQRKLNPPFCFSEENSHLAECTSSKSLNVFFFSFDLFPLFSNILSLSLYRLMIVELQFVVLSGNS